MITLFALVLLALVVVWIVVELRFQCCAWLRISVGLFTIITVAVFISCGLSMYFDYVTSAQVQIMRMVRYDLEERSPTAVIAFLDRNIPRIEERRNNAPAIHSLLVQIEHELSDAKEKK